MKEASYQVRSLVGRRFGRLLVRHYAGPGKDRHAEWCCACDCGVLCLVPGRRLVARLQLSCGCLRADPEVRAKAREKVPARHRRAIACAGAAAVRVRREPYALGVGEAGEQLGLTPDMVMALCRDGTLGYRLSRRGKVSEVRVSAGDVARLLSTQARAKRHCRLVEERAATGNL